MFPEERVANVQANMRIVDLCKCLRVQDELTNKDSGNHAAMEAEWIKILGEDMLWHELTIDHIATQQAVWLGHGLSPARINRYTTRLHKIFAEAVRRRMIRFNPISGYVCLKEPRGRRRKLGQNEELLLRTEMTADEWRLVDFAISGFRQEEQFRCRVEYVDLVANTISLPETKTVALMHEGRTIPMSQRLRRVVEEQLKLGSQWLKGSAAWLWCRRSKASDE